MDKHNLPGRRPGFIGAWGRSLCAPASGGDDYRLGTGSVIEAVFPEARPRMTTENAFTLAGSTEFPKEGEFSKITSSAKVFTSFRLPGNSSFDDPGGDV